MKVLQRLLLALALLVPLGSLPMLDLQVGVAQAQVTTCTPWQGITTTVINPDGSITRTTTWTRTCQTVNPDGTVTVTVQSRTTVENFPPPPPPPGDVDVGAEIGDKFEAGKLEGGK
jgi:hypothetical protein